MTLMFLERIHKLQSKITIPDNIKKKIMQCARRNPGISCSPLPAKVMSDITVRRNLKETALILMCSAMANC